MSEQVLVSACLLGAAVRYNGAAKTCAHPILRQWLEEGRVVWIGYAFWELRMERWAKTVAGAPIRIDLFLTAPLLYLLTAATVWSCIVFEKGAARGLDPVKPIRPGPYALTRNRRFVIGFAIALVSYPLLSLLFWLSVHSTRHTRSSLFALLVMSALSVFLVRGHRWARWCLLLWFVYATLSHFIGWSSLLVTSRQDMVIYRISSLTSLVIDIVLGGYLLFSRRLREHLDVHSAASRRAPTGSP